MKTIIKGTTIVVSICFMVSFNSNIYAQSSQKPSKEIVIAQMNYCINSLTNIVHNKSMSILEHESDQILNNLTIEQIIGLYEINEFRVELLDAINKFQITEQERQLLRRIQSIKKDNMKWAALSNALNPTMLLTGGATGPQLAFQVLLTTARTAVEYQTMKNDQNIEELRAMWELRKTDMNTINDTRKTALNTVFNLYNKYNLRESDRLTESTANEFCIYISESDAAKRARLLEDNKSTYEHIADYYYHLGMAYLDLKNYNKAKANFITYLNMYQKAPLLRYDEKSGCIALAILTYEKQLSDSEKKKHIENVLKNMPHNSAAILQCAIICLHDLKENDKALNMIRAGIEDPNASDKSLLYLAAANLLPIAKQYPKCYTEICSLFQNVNSIPLEAYITFAVNTNAKIWEKIQKVLVLEDVSYRDWSKMWLGKSFNENLHIVLPENIIYDPGDVSIYLEKHDGDGITIRQMNTSFANGVDIKEFESVDCFKANKDLKYLYFDALEPNKTFILKRNIDYKKIKDETWPRQSEFVLSEDGSDIDDIIEFCKDHAPKNFNTELKCDYMDGKETESNSKGYTERFIGKKLKYTASHSNKQSGFYLRIVLENGISIMYKMVEDNLNPYMFRANGRNYFKSQAYLDEYHYKGPKEPTWMEKTWDKTKDATKKFVDDAKESEIIKKVKGLFSNDNNEEKEK